MIDVFENLHVAQGLHCLVLAEECGDTSTYRHVVARAASCDVRYFDHLLEYAFDCHIFDSAIVLHGCNKLRASQPFDVVFLAQNSLIFDKFLVQHGIEEVGVWSSNNLAVSPFFDGVNDYVCHDVASMSVMCNRNTNVMFAAFFFAGTTTNVKSAIVLCFFDIVFSTIFRKYLRWFHFFDN